MGKKKHPETDKEKELLEKRLLKMQIAATITEVIVGAITGISALVTAIVHWFKWTTFSSRSKAWELWLPCPLSLA